MVVVPVVLREGRAVGVVITVGHLVEHPALTVVLAREEEAEAQVAYS